MKAIRNVVIAGALLAVFGGIALAGVTELPEPGVNMWWNPNPGYVRTWADRERDLQQHPIMMVVIFGGANRKTTFLEVMPTDHYWSALFAVAQPLRRVIQAVDQTDKANWDARMEEKEFLAWHNDARVDVRPLSFDSLAEPNTVDMVLLSKKLGKLMASGNLEKLLASARKALKLGGVLLVEDYRASGDKPQDPKATNGYIREDYAIAEIQKAGFTLEDTEDKLLANPKDPRTKPAENSDRFLLKFKKWN